MNTVEKLLDEKGRHVEKIHPSASLVECSEKLADGRIGSLLVMVDSELRGIVTRNDIIHALADNPEGFTSIKVSDVMTTDVVTTTEDEELKKVESEMIRSHLNHVPVMRNEEVVGVITRTDVLSNRLKAAEHMNEELEDYIISHYPGLMTTGTIE